MIRSIATLSLALLAAPAVAGPAETFAAHCASCHGAGRLGGIGPALIPETLGRMRGPDLASVIANGRAATQMPGFAATLDRRGDRGPRRLARHPARRDPALGRAGDRRLARPRPGLPPGRSAGLPGRPAQPLRGGGDRRPPHERARRRPLRGARPRAHPLRRARRPEVLAGRPLRLPDVARRLGAEVRPLDAGRGRPGARRPQQPQHRDVQGRPLARRRQLPAGDADHPLRRRPLGRPHPRRRRPRRHALARLGRLPGARPRQLRPRAQGRARDLGGRDRPGRPAGARGLRAQLRGGHGGGARRLLRASSRSGASRSPSRSTTSSSPPTTAT